MIGTLTAVLTVAAVQVGAAQANVVPGGPQGAIARAVAAARPHDTVRVGPGVYAEPTVVIDRPLVLVGLPGAILDGRGERGLVRIESDSVTVRGFTFRDTGVSFTEDRAAVHVEKAGFCHVAGNHFDDTFFGVYLAGASDCTIRDNTFQAVADRETRAGNGIHLWYSVRVTIEDNVIRGHRDGIYFEFVEDSRVSDNVSERNLRYGLHFMFSDGCTYVGNRFVENGAGVAVMYTERVVMERNTFERNRGTAAFGLLLKDITDSRIEGNHFVGNSVALHAEGVRRIEVTRNRFHDNGWAIQVMANAEEADFVGNDFAGNSFDVSTNSRRTATTFTSNYWDRYRGYDLDRDGVGDVPFHPVRLFSLVVQRNPPAMVLMRSFLVTLLDLAEQLFPVLTPENLVDPSPAMTSRVAP